MWYFVHFTLSDNHIITRAAAAQCHDTSKDCLKFHCQSTVLLEVEEQQQELCVLCVCVVHLCRLCVFHYLRVCVCVEVGRASWKEGGKGSGSG